MYSMFIHFSSLKLQYFSLLFLFIVACSDSSSINNDGVPNSAAHNVGSYAFSVIWDDAPKQQDQDRTQQSMSDCGDIDTVEAVMYDISNVELIRGEWPCVAHKGELQGIEQGSGRWVYVIGKDTSGYVLYAGKKTNIQIIANQTTESQNPIVASAFIPPEMNTAPGNNVTLDLSAIRFEWGSIPNASEYKIIISENSDLSNPVISSSTTSLVFSPSGLSQGKYYYWSIYSVDSENNSSIASTIQSFSINNSASNSDNLPPSVNINNPANNSTFNINENVTFNGSGNDSEDGVLSGGFLQWSSNKDGSLGGGELVSTNSLTLGTHIITLTANDSNGSIKTTSITVYVIDINQTDTDGDGVADENDNCPNTPSTLTVLSNGCPEADFNNSLGMSFIFIPPVGGFSMGSPTSEVARDNDEVQHNVTLTTSYEIQIIEVTQSQWEAVMGNNPSISIGCPDCPVENVSWYDVQDFISALNSMGEGTYSLPTEAQWEYASRAGATTAFSNGDITEYSDMNFTCNYDSNLDLIGWYCNNSNDKTHKVAQKAPNSWGLYDMSGNVAEWCQDWYGSYPSGSVQNSTGPSEGTNKILRGGCFLNRARAGRSADRSERLPTDRANTTGFRMVKNP